MERLRYLITKLKKAILGTRILRVEKIEGGIIYVTSRDFETFFVDAGEPVFKDKEGQRWIYMSLGPEVVEVRESKGTET